MNSTRLLRAVTVIVLAKLCCLPATATLYGFTGPGGSGNYTSGNISPGALIPDYPQTGAGFGFNFSATGLTISSVVLSLSMSGGYNGEMYGYLQHGGTLVELFNPSSFVNGANGSSLNLTLSSSSGTSFSTASAAELAAGHTYALNLGALSGADPYGLWTLYFEDRGAGDQMTLNNFNLSINAVPEPVNVALSIFGSGLIGIAGWREWRKRHARKCSPVDV